MGKKNLIHSFSPHKPYILYEGKYTETDVAGLHKFAEEVVDIYQEQVKELFEIAFPSRRQDADYENQRAGFLENRRKPSMGNWIFFPWSKTLVHAVSRDEYFTLRTNRNRELITPSEQKKLSKRCVGIAGLSIGSHFAVNLAYSGITDTMKLAEFDTLETSNLNRIHAALADVGKPKILLGAAQIYAINPYATLSLFTQGIKQDTLHDFFFTQPKPDIILEAIDDFVMKIKLRQQARSARIPVVMLTNLEDSILIDIERYDLDPKLPLFNGLIGNTPEQILSGGVTEREKVAYAIKIVGIENIPTKALRSLSQINKTLVGRPQLNSTVAAAGGIASYLVRKILLGDTTISGRKMISLNSVYGIEDERADTPLRRKIVAEMKKRFSL